MSDPEEKESATGVQRLTKIVEIGKGVFEALGVRMHPATGNLLPFSIRTRDEKGEIVEKPIFLAIPSPPQRFKARKRARERAEEFGLDPRRTGPDAQDADAVEELERLEVLAFAIRENDEKNPSQMFINGEELQKQFANYRVLEETYTALDQWTLLNDPRFGELDGEKMWRVINAVAKEGTTRPLWLIGGLEQIGCIIFMAKVASRSPTNPFSQRSSSTSSSPESTPSSSESTPPS